MDQFSSGTHLIIGPPGTGKTHTLKTIIDHYRQGKYRSKYMAKMQPIVVCSMTVVAAKTIAERAGLSSAAAATVHALCFRALGGNKSLLTPTQVMEWNALVPSARIDMHQRRVGTGGSSGMLTIERLRHQMRPVEEWPSKLQSLYDVYRGYLDSKKAMDFTDMLCGRIDKCIGEPTMLLVDEAQDLTKLEMSIVMKWAKHTDCCILSGDPRQSIHGFRGADGDAIHDIADSLPSENVHVLGKSYRVPGPAHKIATSVAQRLTKDIPVEYLPADHDGVVERVPSCTIRTPQWLITDVCERLDAGESVMVSCCTNSQVAHISESMRLQGLVAHNPHSSACHAGKTIYKVTNMLVALLTMAKEGRDTMLPQEAYDIYHAFTGMRKGLGSDIITLLANDATECGDYAEELIPKAVLRDIISDETLLFDKVYQHLLHKISARLLPFMGEVMADLKKGTDIRRRLVTVGTIFSFKGAEADNVYVFPDLPLKKEARRSPEDQKHKLFYVAVTRAKKRLCLLGSSSSYYYPWPSFGSLED